MYDQLVNETNLKAQENPFLKTLVYFELYKTNQGAIYVRACGNIGKYDQNPIGTGKLDNSSTRGKETSKHN